MFVITEGGGRDDSSWALSKEGGRGVGGKKLSLSELGVSLVCQENDDKYWGMANVSRLVISDLLFVSALGVSRN